MNENVEKRNCDEQQVLIWVLRHVLPLGIMSSELEGDTEPELELERDSEPELELERDSEPELELERDRI